MKTETLFNLALNQATSRESHRSRITGQALTLAKHGQLSQKAKDRLGSIIRSNAANFDQYCFTWEMRDCRKQGCTRCPHGPYLYARLGKVRTYIGR